MRALVLFGSRARRDAQANSDVDILQLVTSHSPSYQRGRFAFSVYTLRHLERMGAEGSLFTRHILREGVPLDSGGTHLLQRLGEVYRTPSSYRHLLAEVRSASALLDVTPAEYSRRWQVLNRVAVHLLRSAVYGCAQDRGCDSFALGDVQAVLGDRRIGEAMSLKSASTPDHDWFLKVRLILGDYCGGVTKNSSGSLEALLVNSCGASPLTVILGLRLLNEDRLPLVYEDIDLASRMHGWPD